MNTYIKMPWDKVVDLTSKWLEYSIVNGKNRHRAIKVQALYFLAMECSKNDYPDNFVYLDVDMAEILWWDQIESCLRGNRNE